VPVRASSQLVEGIQAGGDLDGSRHDVPLSAPGGIVIAEKAQNGKAFGGPETIRQRQVSRWRQQIRGFV
jgi:hypothetical protein